MPFGGFGGFLHGCQLELRVVKSGSDMMDCWLCSLVADDGIKGVERKCESISRNAAALVVSSPK